MFLEKIDVANAEPAVECQVGKELGLLAASLDTRFLRVGTTLAAAVETIDRVIGGLDGIAAALDEKTAGAAVASLRYVAEELTSLPARQSDRGERMAKVVVVARTLNEHVLEMYQALRLLNIYGMNIKIAASGEDMFVGFVNGMTDKLVFGEQELSGFIAKLKDLTASVASVGQADRLLAIESSKVIPAIPMKLGQDAEELSHYLADVATLAGRVATIARSVQAKVAIVLGALQVGDSTRQRLEHIVSALQLVDAHVDRCCPNVAVVGHVHRLLSAQLGAIAVDFEREAGAMLSSLSDLAPDISTLRDLIIEQDDGGGRVFLGRLDQGVTDVERVTGRLRDADARSKAMVGIIADTASDLSSRLVNVQHIRLDVQDIATNTRVLCWRMGAKGKAVSVIATEVDGCATQLGAITDRVADAIGNLSAIEASLRGGAADDACDVEETLAGALAIIRHACQRTEQVTMEGGDDARDLADMLTETSRNLREELGVVAAMASAADTLKNRWPVEAINDEEVEALKILLPQIAKLYTMAQEREVHAQFMLPCMVLEATVEVVVDDDDDDGLF